MVSIYAIKNLINNKVYVGSTKSLKSRKYKHFHQLKTNTHVNEHLQCSYNEYGKDKFSFFLLEECDSTIRKEREIYWINQFNSHDKNFGYNIYEPNENNFKCSDETKQKILNNHINSGYARAIDAYTIDLVFIASFNSIKECAKYFSINQGVVNQIVNGKRLTFKGMTFFRKNETPFLRKSPKQRNQGFYVYEKNK